MDLKEALQKLEYGNDEHWTVEGAPALAILNDLVGRKVTRQEVVDADPSFTRASLAPADPDVAQVGEDEEIVETHEEREATAQERLDAVDKEIERVSIELSELQSVHRQLVAKRKALAERFSVEYDPKRDQERRMALIKKNNERRRNEALARQERLKHIDPAILKDGRSQIDIAAKRRRDHKPMVPHRIFEEGKNQKE